MLSIAAIDVGSNALRLTIGEVSETGKVAPVENIRVPVRLGEDVFRLGRLEDTSIQQMEEAFHRFQRVIEDAGVYTLRAVATSAMRDAANGPMAAERLQAVTGIRLEIIDSTEEARLIHLAVRHVMDIKDKRTLLIDIGGGSVEVTLSTDETVSFSQSYPMGAVRLLKMMENKTDSGQSAGQMIAEVAEPVRRQIEQIIDGRKVAACVATGGSMEELGRMRLRLFKTDNSRHITMDELQKMIQHLRGRSVEAIMREFELRPDRADVVFAAAVVLQLIASSAHVKQIELPNVSLKDGLLFDLADQLSRQPHPDRRARLLESALHMGHKYQFDERHAVLTAKLCRQLFDQLAPFHKLGEAELLLLEVGALLHDIGHFINTIDHDKHGYYLLKVNHLIGLSHREQMIVANLVRYHRGRMFFLEEEDFKSLPSDDRRTILRLAALLSLADAMDVSHTGRVQTVALERAGTAWKLVLPDELTLEKWTANKRKTLFEEAYGARLKVE